MMYNSFMEFGKHDLQCWNKHGILGCGFEGGYRDGELFMQYVAMPEVLVRRCLDGEKPIDWATVCMMHYDPFNIFIVYQTVFYKCVEQGFCFDGFLEACGSTKAMDKWFMSNDFMDDVDAGDIWRIWHWHYTKYDGYCERFKRLIGSLSNRLGWTSRYLEKSPFSGKRKIYWT